MLKKSLLLAFGFSLCLFCVTACTKKETAKVPEAGVGLLGTSILSYLPDGTQGFLVMNFETDAYKKFRTSQWGKNIDSQLLGSVQQLGLSGQKEISDRLTTLFQKLGLNQSDDKTPAKSSELACFASLGSGPGMGRVGCFIQAKKDQNLDQEFKSMQEFFASSGETVNADNCSAAPGFNMKIETAPPAPSFGSMHFCGKGQQIAFSNDKTVLEDFFANKKTETLKQLSSSAEFTRLGQELKLSSDHYMLGFLNVKNVISVLPDLLAKNQIEAKDSKDIQLLPIDAIGFAQGMGESPSSLAVVSTAARNDAQKNWLTRFGNLGSANVLNGASSSSSFNLSLDGKFITNIKQAALEQMPDQEKAMLSNELAALDNLENLSLAVFASNPTSPFPGVVFSATSPNSSNLQAAVKQQLEGAMAGFGLPVSAWMDKEIEGVKASFIQSPMMGLGAYLGNSGNKFLLATSEEALKEAILALNDSSHGLLKSLPGQSKRIVEDSKPILAAYGDFGKIADSIESVQGNLAAFTGGQGGADNSQLARLKELGSILVAVNFKDGNLKIESSYSAGAKG